jgi:mycothiol synthase
LRQTDTKQTLTPRALALWGFLSDGGAIGERPHAIIRMTTFGAGDLQAMPSTTIIKPFDWRGASESEYAALNALYNAIRAEREPDDPPRPLAVEMQSIQRTPSFLDMEAWAAWTADETTMVGCGSVSFRHAEDNQHVVECRIRVLPGWRRRGIGRALLERIVDMPRRDGRRLMFGWTTSNVPSGDAFLEHVGAERGLVEKVSQLELDQVDHAMLSDWIARAQERTAGFELGFWDGEYPEHDIAAIAELLEVMNHAPRQEMEIEDEVVTPEHLREREVETAARGEERWVAYVRETATGALAGFSEVYWPRHAPALMEQGGTGVQPRFRNRGLGRWLKVAMIERIRRERPEVRAIRTDNADTNEAMLNINIQLGFRPLFNNHGWQIETERVLAYLQSSNLQAKTAPAAS